MNWFSRHIFIIKVTFFSNMKDHVQWLYGNGDCFEKKSMPVFPMSCLLPPHPGIIQDIEVLAPPVKVKSLQTNSWWAVIWRRLVLNLETDYRSLLPLHVFLGSEVFPELLHKVSKIKLHRKKDFKRLALKQKARESQLVILTAALE